jgi:hypothetical protein
MLDDKVQWMCNVDSDHSIIFNNTLYKYLSYILEVKDVIFINVCPISLRIEPYMTFSYLSPMKLT